MKFSKLLTKTLLIIALSFQFAHGQGFKDKLGKLAMKAKDKTKNVSLFVSPKEALKPLDIEKHSQDFLSLFDMLSATDELSVNILTSLEEEAADPDKASVLFYASPHKVDSSQLQKILIEAKKRKIKEVLLASDFYFDTRQIHTEEDERIKGFEGAVGIWFERIEVESQEVFAAEEIFAGNFKRKNIQNRLLTGSTELITKNLAATVATDAIHRLTIAKSKEAAVSQILNHKFRKELKKYLSEQYK